MIAPTTRAVVAFGVGLPVALVPALVDESLWRLWPAALAVYLVAIGLDALLTLPRARLLCRMESPPTLYLGDPDPLVLVFGVQAWPRAVEVEVRPELSALFRSEGSRRVVVEAGRETRLELPLSPLRRGLGRVEAYWVAFSGPLGLIRRTERRALDLSIAVVPDVRAVRAAAVRLFRSEDYLSGLKVVHHLGDGSEFEQLREFVPGLDHRTMSWKHSARYRKLICIEHRAERNHQIVLALDTGHLMGEPLDGLPKLDHAINAALLLAFYGLRSGDRVGLFAFDDKIRTFVEPAAGVHAFGRLQQHTASLEYSDEETNFTLGLTTLSMRLKRRTLIIVLTDFVDTTTALLMAENLQRLGRRHLVVFASLCDPELVGHIRQDPGDLLAMHRAVVADDLLRDREKVLRTLTRAGIMALDVAPQQLSTQLINRYLEIKRREML